MTKSKVFIVILNWNQPDLTIECLRSVSGLQTGDYDIAVVVVDNASSDNSIDKIKKQILNSKNTNLKVKIIENTENLGFAAGNNVGIKYATKNGADYVVVLNNDTRVDSLLMNRLIDSAKKDSKIGLISSKICFEKGFEFHKGRYKKEDLGKVIWYAGGKIDWDNIYGSGRGVNEVDKGQYDKVEEIDYATGTCVLITKELIDKVGTFDERYYMYYEDTDLSTRAKVAGFKVVYEPKGVVWHKVAQSSGIGSGLNDYYTTRNRMLFGMKYARLRTKLALLRESVKLLLTGRKWQRIGIGDYYMRKFGKGSYQK